MKKKLEFAATLKVDELWPEVEQILRQIASMQKEPDESEEEWLSYAFVSDEARIADFIYEDSELVELRDRLKLPTLTLRDLFCDVAAVMHERDLPHRSGGSLDAI